MTNAAPASSLGQTPLAQDAGEGCGAGDGLTLHGVSRCFDEAVALEDVGGEPSGGAQAV